MVKLRRTLVSAALVAAVLSPAAVLPAAPAFAESAPAAPTQNDTGSIAALEKAAADAAKAYQKAKTEQADIAAKLEAFDPEPYLAKHREAQAAAKKATEARTAAEDELHQAMSVYDKASDAEREKARQDLLKAMDKANAAIAAEKKAQAAAAATGTAADDAKVDLYRKINAANKAVETALAVKNTADKALADAKAAAEKPAEKPVEKPADKPAEKPADKPADQGAQQPGTVTPVTDKSTTTVKTSSSTDTKAAAATTTATTTATTGSAAELAETGSNPATPYLALGAATAIGLGAAALYVSRRKGARPTS
ncbi:LAETG motif-containing sortase-dependent surface protein [Kitasatospora sp. NPDC059146]|uniref:LAETG motif-containing sortase-dependent surface protein n=1 Tax=Kitasatospora sp. NPDC059146 TaxID=3346741 RepID=UPI00369C4591